MATIDPAIIDRAQSLIAEYDEVIDRWGRANDEENEAPGSTEAERYSEALEYLAHDLYSFTKWAIREGP